MSAFVKTELGNKLFTIEWLLSVNNSEDQGDPFEVRDCKLVSVSAYTAVTSGPAPSVKLYTTNQSDFPANPGVASGYVTNLSDAGSSVMVPWEPLSSVPLAPPTRFVAPRLDGGASEATSRVACLFETL